MWACASGRGDVGMAMLEFDTAACTVEVVNEYKGTTLHWAWLKGLASVAL